MPKVARKTDLHENQRDPREVKLDNGQTIRVKAVPPGLTDRARSQIEFPDPPTYQTSPVVGPPQEHALTWDVVRDMKPAPPTVAIDGEQVPLTEEMVNEAEGEQQEEYVELWRAYVESESYQKYLEAEQALSEYEQELEERDADLDERMMKIYLVRGVDVTVPYDPDNPEAEENEWIRMQEWEGLDVPTENPYELKFHYIFTELLTNPRSEIIRIISAIMSLSGISEEDIRSAEEAFLTEVQGQDAGADAEANGADGHD